MAAQLGTVSLIPRPSLSNPMRNIVARFAIANPNLHTSDNPLTASLPQDEYGEDEEEYSQPVKTQIARRTHDVYSELGLIYSSEEVKPSRVRQHVNPLKASLMAPVTFGSWEEIYADPSLPLTVDIGSGSGRFLLLLAKKNFSSGNYLGIDVREKLVERSLCWRKQLNLNNIYFMTTNATFAFGSILASYPGDLVFVSVLCPDPQFKNRHIKRRIVQMPLVDAVIKYLVPGGKVYLASDVEAVAIDMQQQFGKYLGTHIIPAEGFEYNVKGWLLENPLGIPTEREIAVLVKNGKMYRLLYERL